MAVELLRKESFQAERLELGELDWRAGLPGGVILA